jgi:NAD(P)-dependent dehydrogenase (short-subunit alcohol dehydrogenase family)
MKLAITGSTSGIGVATINGLAKKFDVIFLLVRNKEKAKELIPTFTHRDKKTAFHIVYCDLSDLKSVASAAEFIKEQTDQLDVLINNAGGINKDRKVTKDGFEASFSINHLGPFLLTKKLLPLLEKSPSARIINVSSEAHKVAKPDFDDLQSKKSYSALSVYANVKLFNILFTRSLVDRYADKGIYAFALHPGMVKTEFGSGFKGIIKWGMKIVKFFLVSPEKGAQTSIFLATDPEVINHNGAYFKKSKVSKTSEAADSVEMRNRLWEISEHLIQPWC